MESFWRLLILVLLPVQALADTPFRGVDWHGENYQILHGDFNGDAKTDSVIVAKSAVFPSIWFSAVKEAGPVQEFSLHYNPEQEFLVSGDFDNDGKDEILVMQQDLSGRYVEMNDVDTFVEDEQRLQLTGYNQHRQIDFTALFKGDFNGDGADDLLAYAAQEHDLVVFHNMDKGNRIQFKFDAQLNLTSDSAMSAMVFDVNTDGLEDIVLLPGEQQGSTFVAFAGHKGRFKQADFEDIGPYLGGVDWSLLQHSYHQQVDPATGEARLLRLTNSQGGIDEEGNIIASDDDIVDTITPYELMASSSVLSVSGADGQCQHLAYSPIRKAVETACVVSDDIPVFEPDGGLQGGFSPYSAASIVGKNLQQNLMLTQTASATSSPGTIYNHPEVVGGSYHPVNSSYTVTVSSVATATYYELYIGTSSGSTPFYGVSSSTTFGGVPTGSSYGYRYIKYKACNSAGCSNLSPWRRIRIYTNPGAPNGVAISPSSLYQGSSATLSWSHAGGIVSRASSGDSGYYNIFENRPGGGSFYKGKVSASSGTSLTFSVSPNNEPGSYGYRIQACNPNNLCGGSSTKYTTLLNRSPDARNDSASVNEGGSVTIYVTANDTEPDGHSLSIASYTQPNKGSVSCNSSSCTFNANQSISSDYNDSFSYTISDGYGGSDSASVSVFIDNQVDVAATPSISPASQTFNSTVTVTMSSATSGATIYYTTDGSTPNTSSERYTGAFTLTYDKTVKAIAVKSGYVTSGVRTNTFTRNKSVALTVTYRYDALGRLVKVVEPVNGDREYDYDAAGNREAVSQDN